MSWWHKIPNLAAPTNLIKTDYKIYRLNILCLSEPLVKYYLGTKKLKKLSIKSQTL